MRISLRTSTVSLKQTLLDANSIPYDYEAYLKVQNKAGQKDVELMSKPRIIVKNTLPLSTDPLFGMAV